MEPKERIIIALDVKDVGAAIALADDLADHVGGFKVGLELITSMLAQLLSTEDNDKAANQLQSWRELFSLLNGKLFWDGKLCDIPNTVAGAAGGLAPLKPMFFNVHASAGEAAVKAAVANKGTSKVLGVTVLTSIDEAECRSIFGDSPGVKVLQFARLLVRAGADGIICSPQELELLEQAAVPDPALAGYSQMEKVIPGIRPAWAATGDQKRVMTPGEAIRQGATRLVIGRPITQPPAEIGSPVEAAKRIAEEIAQAA